MKVYFYDRESGVYQGEGFETAASVLEEDGVTVTATPPYERGFVPVFSKVTDCWILKRHDNGRGQTISREQVCRTVKPTT